MATLGQDIIEETKQDASHLLENARERMQVATRPLREAAHDTREVGTNFEIALRKSLRDNPAPTLAMAAAVGFILGAIWRS